MKSGKSIRQISEQNTTGEKKARVAYCVYEPYIPSSHLSRAVDCSLVESTDGLRNGGAEFSVQMRTGQDDRSVARAQYVPEQQ
jgi:hypothetical protein